MSAKRNEQYRWALWAALILAIFAGYGCGATDPGASGDDGAAHPGEERTPEPDAGTVETHQDADMASAWLDGLDGLASIHDGSNGGVEPVEPDPADSVQATVEVTPAPYVPPPVAPAPPVFSTGCAEQIVLYDWDVSEALYVMSKESGGDPWALNPSGACGCFQMLACVGHGDPVSNVAAAYGKWQDQANHMGFPGFHWHWYRWWP